MRERFMIVGGGVLGGEPQKGCRRVLGLGSILSNTVDGRNPLCTSWQMVYARMSGVSSIAPRR